jgi:Na+-transporting methylmalonyl-CoA/oxaloacetate decarboxylase gamma subunit
MAERMRLGVPIVVLVLLVLLAAGISHVSFVGTRYGPPSEPYRRAVEAPSAHLPRKARALPL